MSSGNPTFTSRIIVDGRRIDDLSNIRYALYTSLIPLGSLVAVMGYMRKPKKLHVSASSTDIYEVILILLLVLFAIVAVVAMLVYIYDKKRPKTTDMIKISASQIEITRTDATTEVYPFDEISDLVIERGASYHSFHRRRTYLYDYDNWVKFRVGDQTIAYEFAITSTLHNDIFVQVIEAIRDKGYAFKFLSV